jgi:hypothetical protein
MLNNLNDALTPLGFGPFPAFELHPIQLTAWIDTVWETWRQLPAAVNPGKPSAVVPGLGHVTFAARAAPPQINAINAPLLTALDANPSASVNGRPIGNSVSQAAQQELNRLLGGLAAHAPQTVQPLWPHLMYAYLIENTRVLDICERILREALHDESFGPLCAASVQWLRATEEMFFRDHAWSMVQSVTSWVRPDLGSTRRNAYFRMFGMDLNHGMADGRPYAYTKPTTANTDFVRTLQELLREIWRGHVNATNTSGPNTTDTTAIADLLERLQQMMNGRRMGGDAFANLAREELASVSMMSWFALTLRDASPIVKDLRAQAASPEERLSKLGERVKLAPHAKSRSFFILAENLPPLLQLIEGGFFTGPNAVNAALLYTPLVGNTIAPMALQVINHWSLATGVDLKAVPTTGAPRASV